MARIKKGGPLQIFYGVTATLPTEQIAQEYIEWLKNGHISDVLKHGAKSFRIVHIESKDSTRSIVETQYTFASREAFDSYDQIGSKQLRDESRKIFGPKRGITMERRVGSIEELANEHLRMPVSSHKR